MQTRLIIVVTLIAMLLQLSCGEDSGNRALFHPSMSDTCFIVDQACYEGRAFINLRFLGGSCGQEFRPNYTSVDEVRLQFCNLNVDTGTVFVRIRNDSISGHILGTSREHYLECDGTIVFFFKNFAFSSAIKVFPESLYVFEIVASEGFNLLAVIAYLNEYSRGCAIYRGEPQENVDFNFEIGKYYRCWAKKPSH